MKVPVHLYSNLQRYTGGHSVVETEGATVGKCLTHLVQKFPELNPIVFSANGKIHPFAYISVNLESPRSETLERLLAEGDRIYVILIVAGG